MQAVILTAGKGTRLAPLTDETPKTLLEINGRTIIERIINEFPKEIDEIIIVINNLGKQIKEFLGNNYRGRVIKYILQNKPLGTAHALQICKKLLKNRFLVLMGDNIYRKKDINRCLRHDRCILVYDQQDCFDGSEVVIDEGNNFVSLQKVINKNKCLVNTGLYVLDKSFFSYDLVKIKNGEYGLPQTLVNVAKRNQIKVEKTKEWIQINNHEDLIKANKIFKK